MKDGVWIENLYIFHTDRENCWNDEYINISIFMSVRPASAFVSAIRVLSQLQSFVTWRAFKIPCVARWISHSEGIVCIDFIYILSIKNRCGSISKWPTQLDIVAEIILNILKAPIKIWSTKKKSVYLHFFSNDSQYIGPLYFFCNNL